MPDTQTLVGGTLKKHIAHNHSEGTFPCDLADSFRKGDDFAKTRSAMIAVEQMFLDGLFFRTFETGEPIVRQDRRVNRACAVQDTTPMHSRNR